MNKKSHSTWFISIILVGLAFCYGCSYSVQNSQGELQLPPSPSPSHSAPASPLSSVTPSADIQALPEESMIPPSEIYPAVKQVLDDLGQSFSGKEYGIKEITSDAIYLSPSGDKLIFLGYSKDSANRWVTTVYLLDKELHLTRVIEGIPDENYYLRSPNWSGDESIVVIPFYRLADDDYPIQLFHLNSKELQVLPVKGQSPAISPDKNKIAFIDKEKGLSIYDITTATILNSFYKGYSPVWLQDNRRILFVKSTGKDPSQLEGAELEEICMIDISDCSILASYGEQRVYSSLEWLKKDKFLWVFSGYDDGHFTSILDLESENMTKPQEDFYNHYQAIDEEIYLLKHIPESNVVDLLNMDRVIRSFPTGKLSGGYIHNKALLPDNRLYISWVNDLHTTSLHLLSSADTHAILQLNQIHNYLLALVSTDTSKLVFVDPYDSMILFVDTSDIPMQ